ncbi:hypothetical protein S40285_03125 [Stachybotrys chlorohalonatus IBT 40285]|uniref:Uncharacterized protein n=1 Tax=Stachybotrys chlorohalonatus (strain IBT 40285) TaxID=1283841 RepID=A0A084QMB9_STAC4|nr:hypothetical protein S40285_03125 [Stachybotrys chlorohalonata IBT 40285]
MCCRGYRFVRASSTPCTVPDEHQPIGYAGTRTSTGRFEVAFRRCKNICSLSLRLANVVHKIAVTATAKEFAGQYRGKQYHTPDFDGTLDRALNAGVEKVVLTGMSLADVGVNTKIAEARPKGTCFITIGVHPYHAAELSTEGASRYLQEIAEEVDAALSRTPRLLVAFGELGLDYDRLQHADKEAQLATFKAQLELFVEKQWELPLFLHCRNAVDDFVQVMKPYMNKLPHGGVVHSFVGSVSQMQQLLNIGLEISVNGFSFATRESLDMVAAVPLDKLHVETDAPWGEIKANSDLAKRYLSNAPPLPVSKKRDKWEESCMVKERNESCAIDRVAYIIAGLKGITVDEVSHAAWKNSVTMFRLGDL